MDDDANSEWTDQLLQELAKQPNSNWSLNIEVRTIQKLETSEKIPTLVDNGTRRPKDLAPKLR